MYLSDLQKKNIININDGKNLGKIVDIYFNEDGYIIEFVIQRRKKIIKFLNNLNKRIIKTSEIITIGTDVILVKVSE